VDEVMMRMMMFGGAGGMFGTGIDMSAIIAFLVIGVVYLLVPVLGYQTERPPGFAIALYTLIAYGGISLLQMLFWWVMLLDRGNMRALGGQDLMGHVVMLFSAVKLVVFLIAMLSFVRGLRGLRMYRLPPDV
jgi:hypothetical protein